MDELDGPVELGLQMLQERRRQLGQPEGITPRDRSRIARQLELADPPWSQVHDLLKGLPDLAQALDDLWPRVLPYLIKGNEVSPVHHIPYVVRFMARICLAEVDSRQTRRGVLAALLHDIGIGDCLLPKISEASIQRAQGSERERLRRDGIQSRLEHMNLGAAISRTLLHDVQPQHPDILTGDDIDVIVNIVQTHDYAKIPLMEDHVDRRWLLKPGPDDWLKQCHWEADALWMLTPAGILVDLEREQQQDTPDNRRAKLQFNLGLHREIVRRYATVCTPDEMQQFRFHDGLLYRSATGYALARELASGTPPAS